MQPSANCEALVRKFEGFRPTAYKGADDIWTAGIGHTKGVTASTTCTLAQAEEWLKEDLGDAVLVVNRLVTVALNQNQFDALVSFVYNIGQGNFAHSTMLDRLTQGSYALAAAEFDRWNKIKKRAVAGLTARRAAERALFEKAA